MMNRGYTVEAYLELLHRARTIVKRDGGAGGVQFAGDIIVGFPTETDEDYAATKTLVEQARYKNCFIFKYSPRPGTIAIKRHQDDVPEETKRFRNNDLLKLQNNISTELNRQLIGQTVSVLCEGPSGWNTNGDGESVVAGQKNPATSPSPGIAIPGPTRTTTIQLGPTLAAALNPRKDRHGQTYKKPQTLSAEGDIQLTGRTPHDQIVVFNGPPTLAGQILNLKVREAHGLTIFADRTESESPMALAASQ
jgi:tRNA-2-methylthio-N6-dimethylallyladenosine synthase